MSDGHENSHSLDFRGPDGALASLRPLFILRIVRPRIFESKFRNHCAKKLDGALRKPTSFVKEFVWPKLQIWRFLVWKLTVLCYTLGLFWKTPAFDKQCPDTRFPLTVSLLLIWLSLSISLLLSSLLLLLLLHPVSVTRFPSFRTKTLENRSRYLWNKKGSWATQTLAKILWAGILLWRPGVCDIILLLLLLLLLLLSVLVSLLVLVLLVRLHQYIINIIIIMIIIIIIITINIIITIGVIVLPLETAATAWTAGPR